tara:strand:+ start:58 stop:477 length:420 start_codon:yes stop_codon:yes gene_type:complete
MSEPKLKVDASEFIEHTCEFADDIMQRQLGEKYYDYTQGNDDVGYSYTDEGQDIFNELLGEVEWLLDKFGVVNDSAYEEMYIEVYYKNNRADALCYPHCSRAKGFAKQANEKTLSRSSLEHIRSLGYTINDVSFEEVSE